MVTLYLVVRTLLPLLAFALAAVISPMAAISAITSSISSSDSPAARLPCRRGRGSRRGRKYVMQDQGW